MSNNYSVKENPTISDQGLIWDTTNSGWKRSPLSAIASLFESSETTVTIKEPTTQYSAPATGATVAITDGDSEDIHLILTPSALIATLTLTMPATVRDKMTVLVNNTNAVTTLTVDGNGNTVNGAPTGLAANGYFTLKYDAGVSAWYRVG